jgi:pyruvate,water dikinase
MADGYDPLMPSPRAVHHWTTANLGEAAPGVLTPLCMALWGPPGERATRNAAYTVGMMTRSELAPPPDPADWILRPFYGRLAAQVEFFALVGDRAPGTTGADAVASMFGEVPPGLTFSPTRAHYPAIAWKLPRAFASFPRKLAALAADQDRWWRESVSRMPGLSGPEAIRLFEDATARFERTSSFQLVGILCSVQPLYDAIEKLIAAAGVGEIAILSGAGGAEMDVIGDIWRASRAELEIVDVVARHGFHGPSEGELSSVVWREDDAPLRKLIERYAARPDSESPLTDQRRRREELADMQAQVLAATGAARRPAVKLLLALAARRIPLRGVAKRSFLQAIDVARAAARRAGEELVNDGILDERDDVFMLADRELRGALGAETTRAAVARRREQRAAYERIRFAATEWQGLPETIEDESAPDERAELLTGTGVSAGVIDGVVRVVSDPSFTDVEPDEVLVAPTTDPSWSSIMFISSALVVDIGGALSHAAVVARELRIPCVVNTRNGSRVLRTGDRVRVDGDAGTVEVLARAASPHPGG